jgi:hypothetical protein
MRWRGMLNARIIKYVKSRRANKTRMTIDDITATITLLTDSLSILSSKDYSKLILQPNKSYYNMCPPSTS